MEMYILKHIDTQVTETCYNKELCIWSDRYWTKLIALYASNCINIHEKKYQETS